MANRPIRPRKPGARRRRRTIVDVAASPDGMTLATAMVTADGKRLDVITRDLIATGAAM